MKSPSFYISTVHEPSYKRFAEAVKRDGLSRSVAFIEAIHLWLAKRELKDRSPETHEIVLTVGSRLGDTQTEKVREIRFSGSLIHQSESSVPKKRGSAGHILRVYATAAGRIVVEVDAWQDLGGKAQRKSSTWVSVFSALDAVPEEGITALVGTDRDAVREALRDVPLCVE